MLEILTFLLFLLQPVLFLLATENKIGDRKRSDDEVISSVNAYPFYVCIQYLCIQPHGYLFYNLIYVFYCSNRPRFGPVAPSLYSLGSNRLHITQLPFGLSWLHVLLLVTSKILIKMPLLLYFSCVVASKYLPSCAVNVPK